jgi:hypothetical protein
MSGLDFLSVNRACCSTNTRLARGGVSANFGGQFRVSEATGLSGRTVLPLAVYVPGRVPIAGSENPAISEDRA